MHLERLARRQATEEEIASLLREGCVLMTTDILEVAKRHDYKVHPPFIDHISTKIYASDGQTWTGRYQVGGLEVIYKKHRHFYTLLSAELPVEETEWERITRKITDANREVGINAGKSRRAHRPT